MYWEILSRDSKFETLEKEEPFRQVRRLFLDLGLQTVVGISLQAKQRVFGVMLLGTPDNRTFSPAELRLLLVRLSFAWISMIVPSCSLRPPMFTM